MGVEYDGAMPQSHSQVGHFCPQHLQGCKTFAWGPTFFSTGFLFSKVSVYIKSIQKEIEKTLNVFD